MAGVKPRIDRAHADVQTQPVFNCPAFLMPVSYVFLDDHISGVTRHYATPLSIIRAQKPDDVAQAMTAIQAALDAGLYVAGYAAYELGYALDKKLLPLMPKSSDPLLEFGVFERFDKSLPPPGETPAKLPKLTPQWSADQYAEKFDRLLTYIKAGDIYQANLTFPYKGRSITAPDLPGLYASLRGRQPVRYGAIVALGETQILSLSPELFFSVKDRKARARPMKGTAPRNPDPIIDAANAREMQNDEKSKAENLMIVDLLRNDLSRIAAPGSVKVTDLFSVESFPTLHQMTSGIEARLSDGVTAADVFAKLFPCGSVTGAPKIRAMEIIRELEDRPRGPYCGAIGYFDPDGACSFNVAIRTLTSRRDSAGHALEYNVGSGVVFDSVAADEYAECMLKAKILTPGAPDLIETLRWSPESGFDYLEGHIIRLMRASGDLRRKLDVTAIMAALDRSVLERTTPQRVRLSVSERGKISITTAALNAMPAIMRVMLCSDPVDANDRGFRYKTSPMPLYDAARRQVKDSPDFDEMLFVNQRGELTEGSFTNIFIKKNGHLYTPPLSSGLLPGVLRAYLISTGSVRTQVLKPADLTGRDEVYIGNSVRGLMPAKLISRPMRPL